MPDPAGRQTGATQRWTEEPFSLVRVTVGAIVPDCAVNVVVTCSAAATDQFDGASTRTKAA